VARNEKIDGTGHGKYRKRDRNQPAPDSPFLPKGLGIDATKRRSKKRRIAR
jgi:hypothetical protein